MPVCLVSPYMQAFLQFYPYSFMDLVSYKKRAIAKTALAASPTFAKFCMPPLVEIVVGDVIGLVVD